MQKKNPKRTFFFMLIMKINFEQPFQTLKWKKVPELPTPHTRSSFLQEVPQSSYQLVKHDKLTYFSTLRLTWKEYGIIVSDTCNLVPLQSAGHDSSSDTWQILRGIPVNQQCLSSHGLQQKPSNNPVRRQNVVFLSITAQEIWLKIRMCKFHFASRY